METDRRLGQRHHPMGPRLEDTMQNRLQARRSEWIETFRSRARLDLLPEWTCMDAPERGAALEDPGPRSITLTGPSAVYSVGRGAASGNVCGFSCPVRSPGAVPPPTGAIGAQLVGALVGRWGSRARRRPVRHPLPLPPSWRQRRPLDLVLELRSPCHDDGALITSDVVREPLTAADDPEQLLLPEALDLALSSLDALPENWLVP